MLTFSALPEEIKAIAQQHNHSNEKIDVLPSKFLFNNHYYYVITYDPSANELFVRDDAYVASKAEVEGLALLSRTYSTAGMTILNQGKEWVQSPKIRVYTSLKNLLEKIHKKITGNLPPEVQSSMERMMEACEYIIRDQKRIETEVKDGIDLVIEANDSEIVTEDIRSRLRNHIVEMARAGVRQNNQQLEKEEDRQRILTYLEQIRWKNPSILLDYNNLKKKMSHMLSKNSKNGRDMEELTEMVKVDVSPDELPNKQEILNLIRNP